MSQAHTGGALDELCESYEAWKHCITVRCGIALTEHYVRARIEALDDQNDPMTARFVVLYGRDHLKRTRDWFERALVELAEA